MGNKKQIWLSVDKYRPIFEANDENLKCFIKNEKGVIAKGTYNCLNDVFLTKDKKFEYPVVEFKLI